MSIPAKFIQLTTVTVGAMIIHTALDEAGVVWTYDPPLRTRDSAAIHRGQWVQLSPAKAIPE